MIFDKTVLKNIDGLHSISFPMGIETGIITKPNIHPTLLKCCHMRLEFMTLFVYKILYLQLKMVELWGLFPFHLVPRIFDYPSGWKYTQNLIKRLGLRLVKFTVLNISEFWSLNFHNINYHWEISKNVIISRLVVTPHPTGIT